MTVEPARDEDLAICLELVKRSIRELAGRHYSEKQLDAWIGQYPDSDEFRTWKQRRNMLVVREATDIVGFGQIDVPRHEIVSVNVHPHFVRRGIGSHLVERLEEAGANAGLTQIVVQASLNAAEFYEACGYVSIREFEFECGNGVLLGAVFMVKVLT